LPDPPPAELWPWLLAGAAIALAIIAWWWIRRARRPKPPPTPMEEALAALLRLRQSGMDEEADRRLIVQAAADALRTYLQARLELPATARTTAEFARLLDAAPGLDSQTRPSILQLLADADLAKFANLAPSVETVKETLDRVEAIVRSAANATITEKQ
jgi:hypothetical protein